VSFPDLEITFAEVSVESWQKWHEHFVIKGNNSEKDEKSGTLTLLSPNGQKMASIKLHAPAGENDEEHHMLASAHLYFQQMEFQPAS